MKGVSLQRNVDSYKEVIRIVIRKDIIKVNEKHKK